VAIAAEVVEIDDRAMRRLARSLVHETDLEAEPAQLDPAHHWIEASKSNPNSKRDTVAYIVTLDTINFGSGWFPVLRKRPDCSGYLTIATCLKEHFRLHGPWSADALKRVDVETCTRLFEQDADSREIGELMAYFARALRDLGDLLAARFAGDFVALVEAAGGRAARLVEIATEMPLYRDVADWEGRKVAFYKRAQLLAADLAVTFGGEGPGRFADLDELTIFADNLVPHVLRREGVLRYAHDLAERIDRGELIEVNSREEVEIRACALHAVERMVELLREEDHPTSAQRLDSVLWNRGQRPEMKAHPRHRTRSVYY